MSTVKKDCSFYIFDFSERRQIEIRKYILKLMFQSNLIFPDQQGYSFSSLRSFFDTDSSFNFNRIKYYDHETNLYFIYDFKIWFSYGENCFKLSISYYDSDCGIFWTNQTFRLISMHLYCLKYFDVPDSYWMFENDNHLNCDKWSYDDICKHYDICKDRFLNFIRHEE